MLNICMNELLLSSLELQVVKEVCQQFSAGMQVKDLHVFSCHFSIFHQNLVLNSVFILDQTVAVIPVLPHGVVQFGSCMTVSSSFALF